MTAHPLRHAGGLTDGMAWRWMAPAVDDAEPRRSPAPVMDDATSWRWLAPVLEAAALASGNWAPRSEPGPSGWTCFPRVATRTPGPDARAVGEARRFTVATLQRWGVADRAEDIALVVSELLTNALRHALPGPGEPRGRRPVRLGLLQPGPCVLCAVADPSRRPPVPAEPGCLAETGRGLQVIAQLADTWGYTPPSETGKVVWAVLSAKPQALPAEISF
jgi:anti-sigma regulatory factor (Ser/Thr protein kinase)